MVKKHFSFDEDRDTKDYRQGEWREADFINAALRIDDVMDKKTSHRIRTYQDLGYNITQAAKQLGINRTTLQMTVNKMRRLFTQKDD